LPVCPPVSGRSPQRPLVIVTGNLKTQEIFQQDLETWLQVAADKLPADAGADKNFSLRPAACRPLFYPAWEIFPHEDKLPHADVISDRLETLISLADHSKRQAQNSKLVVTSMAALLQKTFAPADLKNRTRTFARGDKIAPLDLIEWLEAQGYEPEAQVTQKGEIALRGGIVDVFPPTSPWPVRLEFFGDELESLREFDPLTQVSRGEISNLTLPPAGELGILKSEAQSPKSKVVEFATLLDYLPRETIFLLCEPESLAVHADGYRQQIPKDDPFFISWPAFLAELNHRGVTSSELMDETETGEAGSRCETLDLQLDSLEAFRPLGERPPEPPVAEAQRREFFAQLHRWLRQDFSVQVFCNNDGECQRFQEIWKEFGFTDDKKLVTNLGALSRGFLCAAAKLVVVTDAEIFGRYKVQRPRRLKSPHALAVRSAMEIDLAARAEFNRQLSTFNRQPNVWSSNTRNQTTTSSRRNFTSPFPRRILSANTWVQAKPIRRCTRSAARAGTRPRSRPKPPCAMSPPKCCASRPSAKRRPVTRANPIRTGSANLKALLFTKKRATKLPPSRTRKPIKNARSRWTV
jgi:transcription-repair coupling factor (superfamily II helicase)